MTYRYATRTLSEFNGTTNEFTVYSKFQDYMLLDIKEPDISRQAEIKEAIREAEAIAFEAGVNAAKKAVEAIPTHSPIGG